MRILICGLPRLLEDAVCAILAADPDLVVVCMVGDDDIFAIARHHQADAVLLHASHPADDHDPACLLVNGGEVRVLTLAGQGGALYVRGERRVLQRRPSAAQLLRAVRGESASGRESRMQIAARCAQ